MLQDFKFEKNLLALISCVRFLEAAITLNLVFGESSLKTFSKLVTFILMTSLTLPFTARSDIASLLMRILYTPSIDLGVPIMDQIWSLIGIDNFQFRSYFALIILPKMIKNSENDGFQHLVKNVSCHQNSDVQNVALSLMFGIYFTQGSQNVRARAFSHLCKLASDQPDLDTIDCILAKFAKQFGYPSFAQVGEKYLDAALEEWDSVDFEAFPYYIFGFDSIDEFLSQYNDRITLMMVKKRQYSLVSTSSWRKSFCSIYTQSLLSEEDDFNEV